jgi:hypothetical protein
MKADLTKPLQFDQIGNSEGCYQIHDGTRQIGIIEVAADIDGAPDQDFERAEADGKAYATLFKTAPQLLYQLEVAIFELERCTGLEEALEPMRAAVAAARAGAA